MNAYLKPRRINHQPRSITPYQAQRIFLGVVIVIAILMLLIIPAPHTAQPANQSTINSTVQ